MEKFIIKKIIWILLTPFLMLYFLFIPMEKMKTDMDNILIWLDDIGWWN